jgi:hypothetical protein
MHLRREPAVLDRPRIQGLLDDLVAQSGGDITWARLDRELRAGVYRMWFPYVGDRNVGLIIVRIEGDTLVFHGAAGDVLGEWEGLDKVFCKLARQYGCRTIEFRGRRGFLQTFKQFGMRERYTVMSKSID